MEPLEINGKSYQVGKMDTFKQYHVARRLAPVALEMQKEVAKLPEKPENAAAQAEFNEQAQVAMGVGMMRGFAQMDDANAQFVLDRCLDVIQRKDDASGRWARVTSPAGGLMYEDIDRGAMMQLVMAVIRELNLLDFFPVGPQPSAGSR
jgi:hypothetical protein